MESTKLYYSKKVGDLETDLTFTCNNDTCTSGEEKLEFKGNINGSGTVLLFKDGNIALCLESEDYATLKNISDERLSTTEQGTCEFDDETKEYAVIGTVSARDYEILQNQYNILNSEKDTLVTSLSNKGLVSDSNLTLEEIASNIDELPVTFDKDENGDWGYILEGEDSILPFNGEINCYISTQVGDTFSVPSGVKIVYIVSPLVDSSLGSRLNLNGSPISYFLDKETLYTQSYYSGIGFTIYKLNNISETDVFTHVGDTYPYVIFY